MFLLKFVVDGTQNTLHLLLRYDGPSKRSRIDYYGDMVKTYQLSTSGPYGTSLKIAPVTTETETNARTCLQVNGTSEYTIEPQTILPDLTNFECTGTSPRPLKTRYKTTIYRRRNHQWDFN
jgi:hypothetical protein